MASSVKWDAQQLSTKIRGITPKSIAYIGMVVNHQALQGQSDMRRYAPWTDRTTNARGGLHAVVDSSRAADGGRWEIKVSHSMYYGVYLELRWGGRFAIILPTIRRMTPRLQSMVGQVLAAAVS